VSLLSAVLVLTLACGGHGDGASPRSSAISQPTDPALIQTASGMLRGVVAPDYRLFAGIPYAAPPIGPRRWQPPAPAAPWPGVREAAKPGPRCIQDPGGDPDFGRVSDEDCLTLNVWTPPPSKHLRPVMVWIHGGAFVNGSGGIYNSHWLATQGDIVVVTINYRLGTLGFLAHPSFGPPGDVGNYGLEDQQAALRWVRDNITNFGGDPDKLTIAGESAGGMSVCDHLVAPDSAGLFRAAIIQSGPCQAQADVATAQKVSLDYAANVGCGDPATAAQCLRALPTDSLRKPAWFVHIGSDALTGPVSGTKVLPSDPMTTIASGHGAQVPVMIGTTGDEFTLFVALQYLRLGRPYTTGQYPELLGETFGGNAAAVQAHYPLDRYDNVALAYSAAVTDGVFSCVAERLGGGLARNKPVYAYEFNDRDAPAPDPLRTVPFPVGASHSLELRYLFDMGGAPPLDPAQRTLSQQMVKYWSSFVTTGVPTAAGLPEWPDLGNDAAVRRRISLQPDGSRVVTDYDEAHQCPFWAGLKG
jgi:para-nitrobenzyl esterase